MNKLIFLTIGIFLISTQISLADLNYSNNSSFQIDLVNSTQNQYISSCPTFIDNSTNILDFSIPWWNEGGIFIGNLSCSQINSQKWFLNYQDENGLYFLMGIRAYLLLIIILIIILIARIKLNLLAHRIMKNYG